MRIQWLCSVSGGFYLIFSPPIGDQSDIMLGVLYAAVQEVQAPSEAADALNRFQSGGPEKGQALNAYFYGRKFSCHPSEYLLMEPLLFSLNTFVNQVGSEYEAEEFEKNKRKNKAASWGASR